MKNIIWIAIAIFFSSCGEAVPPNETTHYMNVDVELIDKTGASARVRLVEDTSVVGELDEKLFNRGKINLHEPGDILHYDHILKSRFVIRNRPQ